MGLRTRLCLQSHEKVDHLCWNSRILQCKQRGYTSSGCVKTQPWYSALIRRKASRLRIKVHWTLLCEGDVCNSIRHWAPPSRHLWQTSWSNQRSLALTGHSEETPFCSPSPTTKHDATPSETWFNCSSQAGEQYSSGWHVVKCAP